MSDEVEEAVAAAATVLYAVPQAEFVPTRKSLAATAKSSAGAAAVKAVLALRKPTVTAWAMNLVPRGDSAVLADVIGLGKRMRAAQSTLDTATLTSLRGERGAAVTAYVDAVAERAAAEGAALSPSAREEVRASAVAALADETAAQALASGQLTRALHYSGFGEVDLSGAVGVTSSGAVVSVLRGGVREVDEQEAEAKEEGEEDEPGDGEESGDAEDADEDEEEADGEDEDELTAEELARVIADAKAAKAQAKARRRAEVELHDAEAQMKQVRAELDEAEVAARRARRAVVTAQTRLDAARAALR